MPVLAAVHAPSASLVSASAKTVLTVRVAGAPSAELLAHLMEEVARCQEGGVSLCLDLRDIMSVDASADVVRDLAANLGDLVVNGLERVAIVSGERRFSLGISRMLQVYAESVGVEAWCFIDAGDAAYWLTAGSASA